MTLLAKEKNLKKWLTTHLCMLIYVSNRNISGMVFFNRIFQRIDKKISTAWVHAKPNKRSHVKIALLYMVTTMQLHWHNLSLKRLVGGKKSVILLSTMHYAELMDNKKKTNHKLISFYSATKFANVKRINYSVNRPT